MNQNTYCPIDEVRIDACSMRLGAFLSSLLMLAYLSSGSVLFLLLLSADFLVKNVNMQYSPLSFTAVRLRQLLGLKSRMTVFAPKRFALRVGGTMLLLILGLEIFEAAPVLSMALSLLMLLFMGLEWAFDYCVGCRIYHLLLNIFPAKSTDS